MYHVVCNLQARSCWTDLCGGGHHNKPLVPAATAEWGHSDHSGTRTCGQNISPAWWCMLTYMSCMMCLTAAPYWIDFQSISGMAGPGHHVHHTRIRHWFLWGYLKDHVHHTNPHSVEKLQVEIQSVAEGIIGGMLRDTADSFVVCLQWVHEVKGSHTEHCSHEDHIYTNSSWTICFCTLENYEYIIHQNCCVILNTLYYISNVFKFRDPNIWPFLNLLLSWFYYSVSFQFYYL